MRRRQLQRAEDAVEDARQAYLQADPVNQLVKADLGALYEAALQRRDRLQDEFAATMVSADPMLTPEDGAELVQLAGSAQELWAASTTHREDQKRILRTLISQIVVQNATKDLAELEIIWIGGMRQPLDVLLAPGVQKIVAERAKQEASVPTITEELRGAGVMTATGRPISVTVVRTKLREAGIPSTRKRVWDRVHRVIQDGLLAGAQRREILRQLNEQTSFEVGHWSPQRLADVITDLRHRPSTRHSLPTILPAELEKQRALDIIRERLDAGDSYEAIAAHLNTLDVKPQRGTSFNRNIVYQLHLRWRRERSATPTSLIEGGEPSDPTPNGEGQTEG